MNFTTKLSHSVFKIYVDETLHLMIHHRELLGVQSWGDRGTFCIEFTFKRNTLRCEYGNKDMWCEILQILDDNILG